MEVKFTTHRDIVDYLYKAAINGTLPVTINSDNVEWIFTMPNGDKYGITNAMAQSIKIKCDERYDDCGNYIPYGGSLDHIKGLNFAQHYGEHCHILL